MLLTKRYKYFQLHIISSFFHSYDEAFQPDYLHDKTSEIVAHMTLEKAILVRPAQQNCQTMCHLCKL